MKAEFSKHPILVAVTGSGDGRGRDSPMDHSATHFKETRKQMIEVGLTGRTPQSLGHGRSSGPKVLENVGVVRVFAPHTC